MNLVVAELTRLVVRRFAQLMVVLLAGAFAITIATTLASSHEPTVVEWQQAEQNMRADQVQAEEARERCQELPELGSSSYCQDYANQEFRLEDYLYGVFVFEREIKPLTYFLVAFLALFGFLVGASFIGAELTSGGMTNLLLWRPQRATVLGTKLGTVVAAVLAVSVVSTVVYMGAFRMIAEVNGLPGELDAAFWGDLVLRAVRGLALVAGATVIGFSVATLGRHTAAAVGAIAAYAIVWEIGARVVLQVIEAARPDQWMFSTYLGAWMAGHVDLVDRRACEFVTGACDDTYSLTWAHAAAVFAVLLAALLTVAFTTFRNRDLT